MMIKSHFKFVVIGFLLLAAYATVGQSAILDKYVKEALDNNLTVQSEFLRKEKQDSRIEQAKKLWRPSVDFAGSYLFAEGGRKLNFPVGDLFNPVYSTLNQLTQTNQFPTDLENLNTQLTPNNFIDMQFSIVQPIVNSAIKYNQMIQNELIRINDLDIALSQNEIAAQVKTGYYNYLKTFEGLRILEETEILLEDVLNFNKKLVQYDKATPDILSDVEFQIANLSSQRAILQEQQQLAKAFFNLLRNQPLDTAIEVDENLVQGNFTNNQSIADLKTKAFANRLEFKKLDVATAVNALNRKRISKEGNPTLGVSGGVGLQVEEFNFDISGPLFTLAVGMNWSIFDGGVRKKRMEEIQIDQRILENDRSQLQQKIEIDITQIFYKLQSLQIQMQAEQVAVNSARKSYNAIKKRYENDKAILIELLRAQNSLTTSELSKSLTKYDYLIQLAELEKTVGGNN
ncbi:MAG: TolC family protein [Bacteroidota bacterium]